MVGSPGNTGQPAAPPPDPRKRMDDLLFQESIGTISAQDAADLGTLRGAGRLKGLEGPGLQAASQVPPPPPGDAPIPPPQQEEPAMDVTIPGQDTSPAPTFADALTRRLGYENIPGEAPNTGSFTDQLYRIANRAVGAFQGGQEEARQSHLPNVNTPLGGVVGGGARVIGYGNAGAVPGAAVEATTGSRTAGTAAELATNLIPLASATIPRVIAKLPSGIAREITSTRSAIRTAKEGIDALRGQIPGAAEEAATGASRLAGELTKDLAKSSTKVPPKLPGSLTKASKALEGVDTNAQTVSGLRKAAAREGVAPLTEASVSPGITTGRNLYGGQETALQNFTQLMNRAQSSTNPRQQQVLLERGMKLIEQHFPGANLPELDQLRNIHAQIASGKQGILDLGEKATQLGTKLASRQATIRRLGRVGLGLYGLDKLSGAITSGLSRSGGPTPTP